MNKQKLILILSSLILVSAIVILTFNYGKRSKTAYVKVAEVYNGFTMQKEMQQQLDNVQQSRKRIIDSMGLRLNMLSRSLGSRVSSDSSFLFEQNEYMMRQHQFEQDNVATAQKYQDQIWKQLNQYINDYGKEKGYAYIFGAEGSGAVMYADEGNDITEPLKIYVNACYSGKK